MLPPETIEEFKELYFKQYGVVLSDEEATKSANNFVNLHCFVYEDEKYLGDLLYLKP